MLHFKFPYPHDDGNGHLFDVCNRRGFSICEFQVIPLQGRPYLEADDDVDNAVCGLLNVHFVIEETSSPGLLSNKISCSYFFII